VQTIQPKRPPWVSIMSRITPAAEGYDPFVSSRLTGFTGASVSWVSIVL
jgi:hypothetical protein